MMTCLKYFLPISCVLLLGVCVWQLYIPKAVGDGVKCVLAGGTIASILGVSISLFRPLQHAPAGQLPGAWGK